MTYLTSTIGMEMVLLVSKSSLKCCKIQLEENMEIIIRIQTKMVSSELQQKQTQMEPYLWTSKNFMIYTKTYDFECTKQSKYFLHKEEYLFQKRRQKSRYQQSFLMRQLYQQTIKILSMGECASNCKHVDRMKDINKGMKSLDRRHSRFLSSQNSTRLKKVRSPNQGLETKKKTMTQAQMKKQLNMIFDIYDKDGDGRLSMIQLRHMFNTIYSRRSGKDIKFSEDQVLNFMKMADRGDEMSLNRQDFYQFYKNK